MSIVSRVTGWLREDSEEIGDRPRCDYCGLPGVCFGADLGAPKHRCPRCCRRHSQFGGPHGPDDYLTGHMAAEGCALDRLPQRAAMSETLDDVAEQALKEMGIQTGVGSFGQDFTASIPCQLRFTEETRQRTERFHDALGVHGFHVLDTDPDRVASGREGGPDLPYYDGEVCHEDHYNRLRVVVFRGGVIRIFPRDDYVPGADELSRLLHALTIGWKSDLEHDPIEREANDAER